MPSEADVYVIDDDAAARESLEFLLRSAGLEVRSYESATAFLQALPKLAPGCIVSDVRMPGMSGIDLLKRLRELEIGMPVIIMTGHGDVPLAVQAMKFGASDFFEKPFDDEALIGAVRAVLAQHQDASRRTAQLSQINARLTELSNRERQVLEGLVAGRPNKVIAYDLGTSPRTVEIYRANVMTKMQAASLSDLVRMALVAGILGDEQKPDGTQGK